MISRFWVALIVLACSSAASAAALELEAKIPLGDVRGRIDHLAIDVKRQRLYVAELGNDTVGVLDLKDRKTIRTLTGSKNRRASVTVDILATQGEGISEVARVATAGGARTGLLAGY